MLINCECFKWRKLNSKIKSNNLYRICIINLVIRRILADSQNIWMVAMFLHKHSFNMQIEKKKNCKPQIATMIHRDDMPWTAAIIRLANNSHDDYCMAIWEIEPANECWNKRKWYADWKGSSQVKRETVDRFKWAWKFNVILNGIVFNPVIPCIHVI